MYADFGQTVETIFFNRIANPVFLQMGYFLELAEVGFDTHGQRIY